MTRNHETRPTSVGYALQPVADVAGKVVHAGGETWAESMHNAWSRGFFARQSSADTGLKLRALFRAIRMLGEGDEKQRHKAKQMADFLAYEWGIRRAYETASEGDADLYDKLKDEWGEVQLPPIDAFVHSTAADEALIASVIRRLK